MTLRGSYDTDQLDNAGRMLAAAAISLRLATDRLGAIADGLMPREVANAVERLRDHGQQMVRDIGEHTDLAANGLRQVAACYRDLDQSMICAFTGSE